MSSDRPLERHSDGAETAAEPLTVRARVREPEWPHAERVIVAESLEAASHWDRNLWRRG
jgi:hypothetical protein